MSETTTDDNGKKRGNERNARSTAPIAPEPKNESLFRFLIDLFETGFPEKLVLCACYGPAGKRLGPQVREIVFKPNEKPKNEELVTISNLLLALAQEDCDVIGKPTRYVVLAYDLMRSDVYYSRKMIGAYPSGGQMTAEDRDGEGDDEEGGVMSTKLVMQLLDSERKDKRWLMEHHANVVTGVVEHLSSRLTALEKQQNDMFDRSLKYMAATEEMLDRSQERKVKAERAQMVNEAVRDGLGMLKSLVPGINAYLSKGKTIPDDLKAFIQSLADDVKTALFGKWDNGALVEKGILDVEQINLLIGVAERQVEPARLAEFAASLRPEQMAQASSVLTPNQIQALVAMAKAASDTQAKTEEQEQK